MTENTAEQVVRVLSDFVNSYTISENEFIGEMSAEHRTIQQSFTKLCLRWIEHCSDVNYRYDGRNKASHEISKRLIEAFTKETDGINPSNFLPMI